MFENTNHGVEIITIRYIRYCGVPSHDELAYMLKIKVERRYIVQIEPANILTRKMSLVIIPSIRKTNQMLNMYQNIKKMIR